METDQFGKYQILGEIGKGGFATVFRALDTTLDRPVALKVLDPLLARDPAWVARFQREAKAVARLKHPHIVTIWEIGVNDGRIFIAMELIDGPSLAGRIAEHGALPYDEAHRILEQVADALDYAHAEGIIHRDLKPANILLDPKRGAILTDFGFARLVGESSMSVSVSGGVVGTPAYIAPEVWDDQDPSAASDLYALGCVAYEMLTGQALFTGKTPMAVMRKHADGPKLLDARGAGLTAGTTAVLRRVLAVEPAGRYPTAGQFAAALQSAQTPVPAPTLEPPAPPLPAEPAPGIAAAVPSSTLATAHDAGDRVSPEDNKRMADQPAPLRTPRWEDLRPAPVAPVAQPAPPPEGASAAPKRASRRSLNWRRTALLVSLVALAAFALLIYVERNVPSGGNRAAVPPQAAPPGLPTTARAGDLAAAGEVFYNSDRDGHREVYAWRPGTGEKRMTFTKGGESWDPCPSRGGAILFTSNRDGKREVYQLDSKGVAVRMTYSQGTAESWGPVWAADGAILFTSNRDGKDEVYRLSGLGKSVQMTDSPGDSASWGPAAGSDGSVYFTSNRSGHREVYRLSGNPSKVEQLTFTREGFGSWGPAPAADGSLLFTSNRDGKPEIYQLSGGKTKRYTYTPEDHVSVDPQPGPGGIWFTSERYALLNVFWQPEHGEATSVADPPEGGVNWLRTGNE